MTVITIRESVEMMEGAGVVVRRLFPVAGCRHFDPFVLLDHFHLGPGSGFPPHPHRGFEAITYLFTGGMRHEDNLGNASTVTAGGAQRFTAGRGLIHSEMPVGDDRITGIQLWINLAKNRKGIDPAYQPVPAADIPVRTFANGSLRTVVGPNSAVALQTPIRYLDVELNDGKYDDAIPAGHRALLYAVAGDFMLGQQRVAQGAAAFVSEAGPIQVVATAPCRFLFLAAAPHNEPIYQHGPYVD